LKDIALLAGLAGLFHDLGKANSLFQKKLSGKGKNFEAYRHEWLSLRLFQAFVGEMSDQEWLERLLKPEAMDDKALLAAVFCDGLGSGRNQPFKLWQQQGQPLARIIGWLILSHHRLAQWPQIKWTKSKEPPLRRLDEFLTEVLDPSWNSPQCLDRWEEKEIKANWDFKTLPLTSWTWQKTATSLARRALRRPALFSGEKDWLADVFSMHVARMALMLGDHIFSSQPAASVWQDKQCKLLANTDRKTRKAKQHLDEHLIGVAHHAVLLARRLPQFRRHLPALARHKGFRQRSGGGRFAWQDKAFDLACAVRTRAEQQGFFGMNMASTGCGKTLANARIMYGLAHERLGCRLSIALGLRTLTLQTGDALRQRLNLSEDELAVLIGSQAVRQLHEMHNSSSSGSEFDEEVLDANQHVLYDGDLTGSRIGLWLEHSPKLLQFISAPILVSTIDHLIPATEGARGGKQIAPMLRLLTSDLILDEPDDFDLADSHALCRLVNWAGLLGSRVLISSATLPPAFTKALFTAYLAGRTAFQKNCGQTARPPSVCCAWFDENRAVQSDHAECEDFAKAHQHFASKRAERLKKAPSFRRAAFLPFDEAHLTPTAAVQTMAHVMQRSLLSLHEQHGQEGKKHKISVGLIRMANIKQLVAVAKELLMLPADANCRIHYCVYHSQHPLAVRSAMERILDELLTRHDPEKIWQQPLIRDALGKYPEQNHIFIVLASPVAEVGRDHDYDFAIAEPSSMRSLIQLAGRIRRHRQNTPPNSPNLLVLSKNYKALIGKYPAYCRPGFESSDFLLKSHDLRELLDFKEQLEYISAIPRIIERNTMNARENFADLEHAQLAAELFGGKQEKYAVLWMEKSSTWCYELQRRTPFRQSDPDVEYLLYAEEDDDTLKFHKVNQNDKSLISCENEFERVHFEYENSTFATINPATELQGLSEVLDIPFADVCRKFGSIRLREEQEKWLYHPTLGLHQELK
jgi:CRISPR-associated endonuclease/helicase Cas3